MAMKVESPSGRGVTVADIVRSFAKGVIGERIAVRKLETFISQQIDIAINMDRQARSIERAWKDTPVIHTDNL
jgi:hypothetical protein